MKVIKPDNLGLLFTPCMVDKNLCLSIGALACFNLDTQAADRLKSESEMWQAVAAELGDAILDLGLPKHRGEFLVYGSCFSQTPVKQNLVKVSLGQIAKELLVTGDRYWGDAGIPTEPKEFTQMRICYENAFGGEKFEPNPLGKGYSSDENDIKWLPNIQIAHKLIASPNDHPEPAGLNPLDPFRPQRKKYLGKFDETWLKTRWPYYPLDTNPEYFNTAPEDQRIKDFFTGDESVEILNMHPRYGKILSRLPGLRARIFLNRREGEREVFAENEARAETVFLLPGAECGIVLYRAVAHIADEELDDCLHIMAEWELLTEQPQSYDHYYRRFLENINPPEAEAAPPPPPTPEPAAVAAAVPPPPPPPPPVEEISPEQQKLLDELKKQTAEMEAQADEIFKKAGMTREEAMAKYLPKQEAEKELTQQELEAMLKKMQDEAEEVFKKAGMTKEEAMAKYLPKPQADPPMSPEELISQLEKMQSQAGEIFSKAGMTPQEAVKKYLPHLGEIDLGPSPLDFTALLALLKKDQAGSGADKEKKSEPAKTEAEEDKTPEPQARITADEAMSRHTLGQPLSGLDLSGLDFSNRELSGADFSSSNLADAKFSSAKLNNANFSGAILTNTDFDNAWMPQVNLGNTQAANAKFNHAVISGANLSEGEFSGCRFDTADMRTVILDRAVFRDATFKSAIIANSSARDADFSQADLSMADLSASNLENADFASANICNARFEHVQATGIRLEGVQAKGTIFTHANMAKARADNSSTFDRADFTGCDLSRGCLEGASFREVRLFECKLGNTDLGRAKFEMCNMVNAVAKKANLMKATFNDCDMRGINFFKASLRKAGITDSDLKHALFYGSDLYGAHIEKCDINDANFKHTLVEIQA